MDAEAEVGRRSGSGSESGKGKWKGKQKREAEAEGEAEAGSGSASGSRRELGSGSRMYFSTFRDHSLNFCTNLQITLTSQKNLVNW